MRQVTVSSWIAWNPLRSKRNGRYTEIMYRGGTYVRMYSRVAVLGSQFRSIPATSILVSNRTLVVNGHAVYMGGRYVHTRKSFGI